jgi:predicted DNA-binding protein
MHHLGFAAMATSFRLPPQQMSRLEYLAKRLGISKAQVVKRALDKYYEDQMETSRRSALDKLMDGGDYSPMPFGTGDLAGDELKQRRIIRAKLAKKGRN